MLFYIQRWFDRITWQEFPNLFRTKYEKYLDLLATADYSVEYGRSYQNKALQKSGMALY